MKRRGKNKLKKLIMERREKTEKADEVLSKTQGGLVALWNETQKKVTRETREGHPVDGQALLDVVQDAMEAAEEAKSSGPVGGGRQVGSWGVLQEDLQDIKDETMGRVDALLQAAHHVRADIDPQVPPPQEPAESPAPGEPLGPPADQDGEEELAQMSSVEMKQLAAEAGT